MAKGKKQALTVRPLQDRIVVRRLDADQVSLGGIVIPTTAQERPQRGEVVAVGPDISEDVAVGEHVLFGKYAGVEVEEKGGELLILRVDDVLGVME